jgi:hypothetical protein
VLDKATGKLPTENAITSATGDNSIPQSNSQHDRLRDRVKRVAERDGYSATRLLRLGWLMNTFAASLALAGAEPCEKRVARAEHRCPKQQ